MADASTQLAMVARIDDVRGGARHLPGDYRIRSMTEADVDALAELYFHAYAREVVANRTDAETELTQTFAGEYGHLDLEASSLITRGQALVGAAMVVDEAPWPGTPRGPFIIEVMVHPDHRRAGLAEYALRWSADRLAATGADTMALFVISDNTAARALYAKLGFVPWQATVAEPPDKAVR